jgi:hypothetical protein
MGIGITCPFLAILKLNKKETPDIRHAQGAAGGYPQIYISNTNNLIRMTTIPLK